MGKETSVSQADTRISLDIFGSPPVSKGISTAISTAEHPPLSYDKDRPPPDKHL